MIKISNLFAICAYFLLTGCSQAVNYKVSSNIGKEYTVSLTDEKVIVYDGKEVLARIDSSIQFTRVLLFQDQMYLVKEGVPTSSFYSITGQLMERGLGQIIYARGDTVLFAGESTGYTEAGEEYSHIVIERLGLSKSVGEIRCYRILNPVGGTYLYLEKISGDREILGTDLEPADDLPLNGSFGDPNTCVS
jgi:hypothetical protein